MNFQDRRPGPVTLHVDLHGPLLAGTSWPTRTVITARAVWRPSTTAFAASKTTTTSTATPVTRSDARGTARHAQRLRATIDTLAAALRRVER